MITSHGTRFVTAGQGGAVAHLDVTAVLRPRTERVPLDRPRSVALVRHPDHGRLTARPEGG